MDLVGLKQNMKVGIFCLTSDNTHRLAIYVGKAVISALVPQDSVWWFRCVCSAGSSELEYVVTPGSESVLAVG
eukprot:15365093-Ditylum_brightwellii.AAC.1